VEAKSDFIISQDKDLLRLRAYEGIPIVTIFEFLNMEHGQERNR
jgi:predicted nucleic acid-binding protein